MVELWPLISTSFLIRFNDSKAYSIYFSAKNPNIQFILQSDNNILPSRLIIRTHLFTNNSPNYPSSSPPYLFSPSSSLIHQHCRPEFESGGSTAARLLLSLSLLLATLLDAGVGVNSGGTPPPSSSIDHDPYTHPTHATAATTSCFSPRLRFATTAESSPTTSLGQLRSPFPAINLLSASNQPNNHQSSINFIKAYQNWKPLI